MVSAATCSHQKKPWFWLRFLLLLLSFSITEKNVYSRKERQQPSCNTSYDGILITDMLSPNLEEVSIKTQRKQQSTMHYACNIQVQVTAFQGVRGVVGWNVDPKAHGVFPPWPGIKIILVTSVYAAPILFQKKHLYSATQTNLQVYMLKSLFSLL